MNKLASACFLVFVVMLVQVQTAKASDCGLLIDFFVGCDVATQEQIVAENQTLQVQTNASANIEIERLRTEAQDAETRAKLLADQYATDRNADTQRAMYDAQREATEARAYADQVIAEYQMRGMVDTAEIQTDGLVDVEQIRANSAFKLALIPLIAVVAIGILVYLFYFRYTEARTNDLRLRLVHQPQTYLPDPYAGLNAIERAYAVRADQRGMTWRMYEGDFQVKRQGMWLTMSLNQNQLTVKED
jgi:hypothetical protein